MTSTWLKSTVKDLLGQVGKAIPGAAGGWIFTHIVDAAEGGSDTDKLSAQLSQLQSDVNSVKDAVQTLTAQLPQEFAGIRKDLLQKDCDTITALYSSVTDQVKGYALQQPKQTLEQGQKGLLDILQKVHDQIPAALTSIDRTINNGKSGGLLPQIAGIAAQQSADFLSYYLKVKSFVMDPWVTYCQGISLLQMASDALGVDGWPLLVPPIPGYPEGQMDLIRYKDDLEQQEVVFKSVVGPAVVALAEAAMQCNGEFCVELKTVLGDSWVQSVPITPGAPQLYDCIKFRPLLDPGHNFMTPDFLMHTYEVATLGPGRTTWRMSADPDIVDFSPDGAYNFVLMHQSDNRQLSLFAPADDAGSSTGVVTTHCPNRWQIMIAGVCDAARFQVKLVDRLWANKLTLQGDWSSNSKACFLFSGPVCQGYAGLNPVDPNSYWSITPVVDG